MASRSYVHTAFTWAGAKLTIAPHWALHNTCWHTSCFHDASLHPGNPRPRRAAAYPTLHPLYCRRFLFRLQTLLNTCCIQGVVLVLLCSACPVYAGVPGGSISHDVAPGHALLRQLQMSQSPQRAQQHQQQLRQSQTNSGAAASGWDLHPTQSASPFFDPAIVNASSAALREAGDSAYVSPPIHAVAPSDRPVQTLGVRAVALTGLPATARCHQRCLNLALSAYIHTHSTEYV